MVAGYFPHVWIKRLACFTLAGFAFVVLAGPILSLLVACAVFSAIGFLLWLPLHTVIYGPHSALRSSGGAAVRCCRRGVRWLRETERGCLNVVETTGECVRAWWPMFCGVLREGTSGAALALVLVLLAGGESASLVCGAVLMGTLAGGLVGVTER